MSLPENMINANISIVLTDIIGSTKFVQKHGAKTAAIWFGTHDRMVLSLITRFNGQWVDNSDGHLMYFTTVQDAIAFSFAYKKQLRTHKFPFRSRVGVHWDNMIITKAAKHLTEAGVKRVNIEGLGKAVAARCMSICQAEQILLTKSAYIEFNRRTTQSPWIPKKAMSALAGLYQFKGVSQPITIYSMGLSQNQLQPPPSGDKVKRLGGAKKIKVRLRYLSFKEKFMWFYWKLGIIATIYWLYILWPLLSSESMKRTWDIDYLIFRPFEWIDYIGHQIYDFFSWFWEGIDKHYINRGDK